MTISMMFLHINLRRSFHNAAAKGIKKNAKKKKKLYVWGLFCSANVTNVSETKKQFAIFVSIGN